MSTITTASFWKDIGYTEGCIKVPSASYTLPTADLTFSNLNPSKARMFTELRVAEDYVAMLDYSYMSIVLDNNNGTDKTFYGWIDSVEMVSDSAGAPITAVHWHVDLWRTYFANAEFGPGMVKRRPVSGDQPPQQPSYRYITPGTQVPVVDNDGIWWVILHYTVQDGNGTVTDTKTRVAPLIQGEISGWTSARPYLSATAQGLSPADFMLGKWDEKWGLDPNNIISVFLSPVAPCEFTGTGKSSSSPLVLSATYWDLGVSTQGYAYFEEDTSLFNGFRERYTDITAVKTDDTTIYAISGLDGETIGTLPWGKTYDRIYYRVVPSSTSCYIQMRFVKKTTYDTERYTAHQDGTCFTIPCLNLELTENSWSSYYYSAERQYAIDQRALNTESKAVSGGLGIAGSALTGAASGAMLGSVVPGIGTLVGGIVGAVGGAITGAISTGGEYVYESNYKNDEMQRMEDYAHAYQADGLLLPGSGFDAMFHNKQLNIVPLTMDTYSATQYTNDLALYGAKVSEPVADCSTLISAGGPLQIQNLVVTGDIPPMAKDYIRQRFAQGVIIG